MRAPRERWFQADDRQRFLLLLLREDAWACEAVSAADVADKGVLVRRRGVLVGAEVGKWRLAALLDSEKVALYYFLGVLHNPATPQSPN